MAQGPGGVKPLTFSAFRPVMVGCLLAADLGIVLVLGIGQHKGWVAPFVGFGIVLIGLVWFMAWSVRHRHDDDRES
jgi:predicted MFS family arabinose efflux permease